ncbi:hypothetical protein LDENG_00288710 [Lucifuga dentata]|nr:hypothetical protein LDENG_00288710 [Lucifuga dentata]
MGSYSNTFRQRFTQVMGGNTGNTTNLLLSGKVFSKWKRSLRAKPGIVSYALRPLHQQQAYCQQLLPSAARPGPSTVKVKHATGLWGDIFSQTDGCVKVWMGNQLFQTRVIYNNNNPCWNEDFYLGMIELTQLKLEPVKAGSFTFMCPMYHGNLYFCYKAECPPGLKGATCSEYSPLMIKADLHDLYSSRNSMEVSQDLLAHLRIGHTVDDPLTFAMKHREESNKIKAQTHLSPLTEL